MTKDFYWSLNIYCSLPA